MRRIVVAIILAIATIFACELALEERKKRRRRRYYGPPRQQRWAKW
jgi:hypothetical protein